MMPPPTSPPAIIYTVGHSNHEPEKFCRLLEKHHIELVIDVRSRPYSRFFPHFNRQNLKSLLEAGGRQYLYLGMELGGKPKELKRPESEAVVWQYLRSRPEFREGLKRVMAEAARLRVCLMCAEADPAACHRGQLLAPELEALGAEVRHILADGSLLPHGHLSLPAAKPKQKKLF